MTIAFSNGDTFEDRFSAVAAQNDVKDPFQTKDKNKVQERAPQGDPAGPLFTGDIDRDHHVPLAGAALEDQDGKHYGFAIDSRIPENPDFDKFLMMHEGMEHMHMSNLMQGGMPSKEAYEEAHDKIATPFESAAVKAQGAKLGKDPEHYLDEYKQFWRDAASIAKEPSDKERHPDAHTTKHKLDEAELGDSFKVAQADIGIKSDAPDYDYKAAQKAGVKPDSRGHMPDTFKLPNHITFSDESQYHGKDGNEGGHWKHIKGEHWEFTPGKTNLENHSIQELQDYFKKYEPKSKLILPKGSDSGEYKVAGDVVPLPIDPGLTAFRIQAAKSGFAQRGLHFNEQTQQWEDINAKIVPFPTKGKS